MLFHAGRGEFAGTVALRNLALLLRLTWLLRLARWEPPGIGPSSCGVFGVGRQPRHKFGLGGAAALCCLLHAFYHCGGVFRGGALLIRAGSRWGLDKLQNTLQSVFAIGRGALLVTGEVAVLLHKCSPLRDKWVAAPKVHWLYLHFFFFFYKSSLIINGA